MADYNQTPTSRFLEDVAEQISYKPLRPLITKELEDHILDRTEAYIEEGMNREEAEKRAVAGMGTAVKNTCHRRYFADTRGIDGLRYRTMVF